MAKSSQVWPCWRVLLWTPTLKTPTLTQRRGDLAWNIEAMECLPGVQSFRMASATRKSRFQAGAKPGR